MLPLPYLSLQRDPLPPDPSLTPPGPGLAQTWSDEGGQLDEFFSEEPSLFAKGDGDAYEWPYVWQGDS